MVQRLLRFYQRSASRHLGLWNPFQVGRHASPHFARVFSPTIFLGTRTETRVPGIHLDPSLPRKLKRFGNLHSDTEKNT